MDARVVEGDLLGQPTEGIVNPWNRNVIPWWLLLPQGVSGAIKRRAGLAPFRELERFGPIPLGGAVVTSPGRLPHRAIIHVAGMDLLWRASEASIRDASTNAVALAARLGLLSLAFPLIGSGSGGFDPSRAERIMRDAFAGLDEPVEVVIVRFCKPDRPGRGRP